MLIKYKDIIRSVPALRFLCDCDDLPFVCSVAVSRNVAILDRELEIIEKQLNKLNDKYSDREKQNGKNSGQQDFKIKKGCEEAYLKDRISLFEFEADLPLQTIDTSFFENIKIKPKYVDSIDFMLKQEVK